MSDIASGARPTPSNVSWWIRQTHRWLAGIFTLSVIVTTIALAQPKPAIWVSYVPLPPLFLLLGTGLYMFVLPYVARWRGRDGAA